MERIDNARDAFRIAEKIEKIKRALKSRIFKYNHNSYSPNNSVFFKERGKIEWSGPATVI